MDGYSTFTFVTCISFYTSLLLGAEHGASSKAGLTSGGLAQEGGASIAHDDGLGVAVRNRQKRRGSAF